MRARPVSVQFCLAIAYVLFTQKAVENFVSPRRPINLAPLAKAFQNNLVWAFSLSNLPAVNRIPIYAQRVLGSPGNTHCKTLQEKVPRELISTSKKRFQWREINTFFGHGFIRNQFGQFLYMANVAFCLNTREMWDKISWLTSMLLDIASWTRNFSGSV